MVTYTPKVLSSVKVCRSYFQLFKSVHHVPKCMTYHKVIKVITGNKPDNDPLYTDVNSNHPPNITRNLPDSISKRINKLSSDEHVFNSTKDLYSNVLKNSGYKQNTKLQHNVSVEAQKRKSNKRA